MPRKITNGANFGAKDVFNITGAETLDSVKGSVIRVVGAALGLDVSHDTGEEVATGYLKAENGKIYSTISPTAQQSIDALIDLLSDDPTPVDIKVNTRKSNAGRDFIVLTMM